jgi:cation:H+ antiporter
MSIPLALLAVAVGIALLTGGAEALVRGAVALARLLGVSPAVTGLTIVAMGTSVPELGASVYAGLSGQADIAVANVVGSNIFNVAAVVGLCATLVPLAVHARAVRLEGPFMFVSLFIGLLLARDGIIDRLEAAFFLTALALFTAYLVRSARLEISASDAAEFAAAVAAKATGMPRRLLLNLGLAALGVALLILGARLLVGGAVELARAAGLTERIVGLTVVAAGTSLPELAASLVAVRRRQHDVALANVIGSNLFNVLGILGVVGLVRPVAVHARIIAFDNWWMVGTAFLLLPLMATGRRVSRAEGLLLLGVYGVYLGAIL